MNGAQDHTQATAAVDDTCECQKALKARIDKDARRHKLTACLFAGTVSIVALACVVARCGSDRPHKPPA
jgi:hypothetical protein